MEQSSRDIILTKREVKLFDAPQNIMPFSKIAASEVFITLAAQQRALEARTQVYNPYDTRLVMDGPALQRRIELFLPVASVVLELEIASSLEYGC